MDENILNRDHSINYSKSQLIVTGVKEVLSFEDKEINVNLENNALNIKGNQLSINEFNLKGGILKIDGSLHSICYTHSVEKMGFIKRLFK